jgi:hypothetical protein
MTWLLLPELATLCVDYANATSSIHAPTATSHQQLELALGPALLPLLADLGQFVWHGSAVLDGQGRAHIFLGESGRGKSTLARRLAAEFGYTLAADDLVGIDQHSGAALFDLPQLKLAAGQPPVWRAPIHAVYLLTPAESPKISALKASAATLCLTRHTAATKLMPPRLLAAHLAAVQQLLSRLPVYELHYPKTAAAIAFCAAQLG